MKTTLVFPLIGLGILFFGVTPGFADDTKKIPLKSVYTTTGQSDAQPLTPLAALWKEDEERCKRAIKAMSRVWGNPAIFMVNGKDLPAAFDAAIPLWPRGDEKAPEPKDETRTSERLWVCAYLGSDGRGAYILRSVEVQGTKVRVTDEKTKLDSAELILCRYFVWAPLGELPAGDYTLELSEVDAKQIVATRVCKVTVVSAIS